MRLRVLRFDAQELVEKSAALSRAIRAADLPTRFVEFIDKDHRISASLLVATIRRFAQSFRKRTDRGAPPWRAKPGELQDVVTGCNLKKIDAKAIGQRPGKSRFSGSRSAFQKNWRNLRPRACNGTRMQRRLHAVDHGCAVRKLEPQRPHLLELRHCNAPKLARTANHWEHLEQAAASPTLVRWEMRDLFVPRDHSLWIDQSHQNLTFRPPWDTAGLRVERTHRHDRRRQITQRPRRRAGADAQGRIFSCCLLELIALTLCDNAPDDLRIALFVAWLDFFSRHTINRHADILELEAGDNEKGGRIGVTLEKIC